jgi:hypothetical protein
MDITIHTGLKRFVLVDRISRVEARAIEGIKTFFNAPVCQGVEALAQLGALHVRHLAGFERHAFLLKINRCVLPLSEALNGGCLLYAELICQSDSAFTYELVVEQNGQKLLKAECIFAVISYDQAFQKEILKTHYQEAFSCLKNDSSAS